MIWPWRACLRVMLCTALAVWAIGSAGQWARSGPTAQELRRGDEGLVRFQAMLGPVRAHLPPRGVVGLTIVPADESVAAFVRPILQYVLCPVVVDPASAGAARVVFAPNDDVLGRHATDHSLTIVYHAAPGVALTVAPED